MPRGDQLSRQWRLIQLIDRTQGITVDDAARDLAVTIRTTVSVVFARGLATPRHHWLRGNGPDDA